MSTYAELYPLLKAKYDVDNFEVIAEAIEHSFSDFFKLDALNAEANKAGILGSYANLFHLFMTKLNGLYTPDEVVKRIYQLLQTDAEIKEILLNNFIFVPPVGTKTSTQLGFLEKIATDSFSMAEPITFLDMMRLVDGLKLLKRSLSSTIPVISVVRLNDLRALDGAALRRSNQVLIVNFNPDVKGIAKWGVVDLRGTPSTVYCETPLSDDEKREFEETLELRDNVYIGAGANSLRSTGYTALAWLDENVTKAWNFDISADFPSLMHDFALVYFGGDNPGKTFYLTPGEVGTFRTPAFRHISAHAFLEDAATAGISASVSAHTFQGGEVLSSLTAAAGLGQFLANEFTPGDIGAVIKLSHTMGWSPAQTTSFIKKARGTLPPGFAMTMSRYIDRSDSRLLTETAERSILKVPGVIDSRHLEAFHNEVCAGRNTNPVFLRTTRTEVPRPGSHSDQEYIAAIMIFTLIRTKAKKRILEIELPPHFELNPDEQAFVVRTLRENAYITEFRINANRSLQAISDALIPTFARNRWLAANGYRPPMVDDYWEQAARYWLLHLHEHNVLEMKKEHEPFKRCVQEMGLVGLDALLKFLNDATERELLDGVYGNDKPAFYAACRPAEMPTYLRTLIGHVSRRGSYFPFSELGIAYQPGNNELLIHLLDEVNALERFDKVILTDILTAEPGARTHFMNALIAEASRAGWVGLIIIPELMDKANTVNSLCELRSMYALLNDVILANRHKAAAEKILSRIETSSNFRDDFGRDGVAARPTALLGGGAAGAIVAMAAEPVDDELEHLAISAFDRVAADMTWPLKKGGVVQLQLQQQQQIEQNRQIQKEQQRVTKNVKAIFTEELVDFSNIDRLLTPFLAEFASENKIYEESASLRNREESLLQGFFHTWVNANPSVSAPHAIYKMTLDAAKVLLRKHRLLASGLNPDNLPKGFFTQRSKDGELVLCYDPALGYVTTPNNLTISLDAPIPVASAWDGDFRQFNLPKYISGTHGLDAEDWTSMVLFAQLQPVKDYKPDFEEFCRVNHLIASGLRTYEDKILKFWPVFLQLWQYRGREGIEAFIAKDVRGLIMPPDRMLEFLLQHQSEEIRSWARFLGLESHTICALGQVYHRNGNRGLGLFLTKLRQIDKALGGEFFNCFKHFVLNNCPDFNSYMTETFFTSMDDMIVKLQPAVARGNLLAWQMVLVKHMQAVSWDHVDTLWQGFDYFLQELAQLDLALDGDEFDDIRPENMLVCMDRIVESLKHIADLDERKRFLKQFRTMDITHGGVPYALKYDGLKYIDPTLQLENFKGGSPTYAPDLKTLYTWSNESAVLNMKRTVASQRQFSRQAYPILTERLSNVELSSRDILVWLLHTQYQTTNIAETLGQVVALAPDFRSLIARHLHHAVYRFGNQKVAVNLEAMRAFEALAPSLPGFDINALLRKYPLGTVLESISILRQTGRWNADGLRKLLALLTMGADSPGFIHHEGYKLATLFGIDDDATLQLFYRCTAGILPVVQNELQLLIPQLLSLDFATSNLEVLSAPENWAALLIAIEEMKRHPTETSRYRIQLIEQLNARGLNFKYSKTGEFRALANKDVDGPAGLNAFRDHEDRLWAFMHDHIAIPRESNPQDTLKPIVLFLTRLQLNRTYLNEIEPLLASLEKTEGGKFWSANYFYQLLDALQPRDQQSSFPISLLKVILQEESIAAKAIDSIEKDFPSSLKDHIQSILNNPGFDRVQQALLCQILLREHNWQGGAVHLLPQIMTLLSLDAYASSRGYALEMLAKCKNLHELESRFANCRWLLQFPAVPDVLREQWPQTAALWLKAMSAAKSEEPLFLSIQSRFEAEPAKQALILHIIAWSSLHTGLKDMDSYKSELQKKAPKLVERLAIMGLPALRQLASCYPQQPSPSSDDLLRLLKASETEGTTLTSALDDFMRKPFKESRADYATVAATRETDLRRMIKATLVSRGEDKEGVSPKHAAQLTLIFSYIKRLESGEEKLKDMVKPISEMNQAELATAFQQLSRASLARPNDDLIRAQIWAVLFEVLGRTTRKYPHLAQQFALIANDICVTAPTRVLQLATGEGKSHFVAMRAARHAGCGKTVDVCTAKRTLAERDLEDYQSLFNYLGLKTAYIHPKSSRSEYTTSQIHYSTTGDLSLFLDEQSYSGQPINIPKAERVGLFDEFDFIRDDEGRKTQYNYARPTGKTPKQMTWFYQAINDFYQRNEPVIPKLREIPVITKALLVQLSSDLCKAAGDNEEKQRLVRQLLRDPLQLVQWLQSAYEAHKLELGDGFTVREENIKVGEEYYPMQEIIPLSSDNQKMIGSTFSAGVHQLLAVRLNSLAKAAGKPQNFHIHPESNIISSQIASQRMQELWGCWEGFSGTISAAQAATLHIEHGTEVLHVPTNQRDLRHWHDPAFYADKEERLAAITQQLRYCLEHQKSILFSCKNDLQVTELKTAFTRLKEEGTLSEDEFNSIIFYTNEDDRSASEVLAHKHEQEEWHGGKKRKGICLVASGFGRGDNVDVEAVFLLSVSDNNDKLQKGGRTARNGEEGEVFQFYLPEELAQEEAGYRGLFDSLGVDLAALDAARPSIAEPRRESERKLNNKNCFERVLLMREYMFNLQNESNQGYRTAIAQYSSWGMKCLGKIEDITQRELLADTFGLWLKDLEKKWIDISRQAIPNAQKVIEIEVQINNAAARFTQRFRETSVVTIEDFILIPQEVAPIRLVVPRTCEPKPKDHAVATICNALTRFPELSLSDKRTRQIPAFLEVLADNELQLQHFATRVSEFSTLEQFVDALEIAAEQVSAPSAGWAAAHTAAAERLTPDTLYTGVSDETRLVFTAAIHKLWPSIQTKIVAYLCAPNVLSAEERIKAVLPVLEYLGKFTATELRHWGNDYIDELDSLLHETSHEMSAEVLRLRLQNSPPMSVTHLNGLWCIAQRFDLAPDSLADLLLRMGIAIQAAPEHRVRMLTKWESWSKDLDPEVSLVFLKNFCYVMEQFAEGRDWDVFASLINKTQAWWSKDATGAYQEELLGLWDELARNAIDLPRLSEVIKWNVAHAGKSWFQLLVANLVLTPEHQLLYRTQISALWTEIDTQDMKKRAKTDSFKLCMAGISEFHLAIASYEDQMVWVNKLLGLEPKRFKRMLELMHEHKALLTAQPLVLKAVLNYMSEARLPLARANALSEVLLRAAAHQERYPGSIELMLAALNGVKEGLIGLPDDKFDHLTTIMLENIGSLLQFTPILPAILAYMCEPLLPLPRVNELIQVLLSAATYQELYPESIVHLIRTISDKRLLSALSVPVFNSLMRLANENMELVLKYPEMLPAMLDYLSDPRLSIEQATLLCQATQHVINYQERHPEQYRTMHLLEGVRHFRGLDVNQLRLLNGLLTENPEHLIEPLFDKTFSYFAKQHIATQATMRVAIHLFYNVAKIHGGDPEAMFATMAGMFNESTEVARHQRLMLMNLLHHNVFEMRINEAAAAEHDYHWTNEKNNRLLELGYASFIQQTKRILDERPVRAGRPEVRDLSTQQQRALLQLTDDMKFIGSMRLVVQETPANVHLLRQNLTRLMSSYRSSWFKSTERRTQLMSLESQVDRQLAAVHRGESHYETVLKTIRDAKIAAMESDMDRDAVRWFKMNRGGQSRYFNTLNKMQDMVLKRWVEDIPAVHRFQGYKDYSHQEFLVLVQRLSNRVNEYDDETNLLPRESRTMLRQAGNFFVRAQDRRALVSLKNNLELFADATRAGAVAHVPLAEAQSLIEELQRDLPRLPGHLVTLANEILARGDALLGHLQTQADEQRRGGVLGGAVVIE